jgi:hypothetical protein
MADENLDIVLEAKSEGEHAIREMVDALHDLGRAAEETNLLLSEVALNTMATDAAMAAEAETTKVASSSTKDWTNSVLGAIPAVGSLLSSISDIPVVGWPAIAVIAAMAVEGVALAASFIVIAAAVTTTVGTVVAGFASMAVAAGLALGAIGGLGAIVVALGLMALGSTDVATATANLDKAQQAYNATQGITVSHAEQVAVAQKALADAQKAYNDAVAAANSPLGQLKQGLADVRDHLAQQALPLAQTIAAFGVGLLPVVQQLGSELIHWFGDRLPGVLQMAGQAVGPLVDDFHHLGDVVGPFIDQMIARMPGLAPLFQQAFHAGVEAVSGLLTNLVRFLDWFQKEWPKLEPIVRQVMDQAGQFIQHFGEEAARLVDWFVANWPEIAHTAQDLGPVLQFVGGMVLFLADTFVVLMRMEERIVAALGAIGGAFSALGGKVRGVESAVGSLLMALSRVGPAGSALSSLGAVGAAALTAGVPESSLGSGRFAAGGTMRAGEWGIVGERGPEWVRFGQDARIFPSGQGPGADMGTVEALLAEQNGLLRQMLGLPTADARAAAMRYG